MSGLFLSFLGRLRGKGKGQGLKGWVEDEELKGTKHVDIEWLLSHLYFILADRGGKGVLVVGGEGKMCLGLKGMADVTSIG